MKRVSMYRNVTWIQLWALLALAAGARSYNATLTTDDNEMTLTVGDSTELLYHLQGNVSKLTELTLEPSRDGVIDPINITWYMQPNQYYDLSVNISVVTVFQGKVTLHSKADPDFVDVKNGFTVISVMKSQSFETAGMVLGWISTIAWDFSFLPQIYHNWRRHSVSGLSFDFLTLNFVGFSCYFVYNAGLYWIQPIKDQFNIRHPNEVLHVRINDVIFPLYAVICTAIQIVQCFFYPKDKGQKVSIPCRFIAGYLVSVVIVGCILAPCLDQIMWIDILYTMSYVKLFISTIKYIPQLYINYKAKSTAGWNIWQVILDFTGGLMSLIQMFLVAANYNDYHSVLTDPTKLGLSVLSIFFNIFFFLQHFWFYRNHSDPVQEQKNEDQMEGAAKSGEIIFPEEDVTESEKF